MTSHSFKLTNREKLYYRLSMAAGLIIFMSVMVISVAFTWKGFNREIDGQAELLKETAIVFGSAIALPMSKGDQFQVQQALTGIAKLETFRYVEVSDKAGKLFAEMGFDALLTSRSTQLEGSTRRDLLLSDDLWVSEPIIAAGSSVGTVKLLADISKIRHAFFWDLFYNILAALSLALAAAMLSRIVIKRITLPIYDLSLLMTKLGAQSDYRARVPDTGKGEFGLLAKSFNQMLAAIESRNRQLIDYQETLEEKVEARTRDFKVAKDEADRANAAKSDFLATMSHEIRTPMNSMLVMSELLASSGLNPRHQHYAEIIAKSGRGLLAIINDILDLSKIQAGKLELEQIEVSSRNLIEDTLSLFYKPALDKGLDISGQIDETVPETFVSDPTRLHQILSNLLNNALKFTESGSLFVRLQAESTKAGPQLRFSVADTGIGINPENSARIFDSFGQADQTTTRRFGGTGLGLAICKRLIDAMGGEFGLDSREGQGSVFHFTLPVSNIQSAEPENQQHNAGSILLIYPAVRSRDVIVEALQRKNFEVKTWSPANDVFPALRSFTHVVSSTAILAELALQKSDNTLFISVGVLEETLLEKLIMNETIADCLLQPVSTGPVIELAQRLINDRPLGKAWYQVSSAAVERRAFPGAGVLLVDDNAINREVAAIALSKFNISPQIAQNGHQAIKLASRQSFDLIFMDCSMPEIDGFEATRQIRQMEKEKGRKPTPIVALTAHIAENIRKKSVRCGMDEIMVKPFTMDELAQNLERFLRENAMISGGETDSENERSKKRVITSQPVDETKVVGSIPDLLEEPEPEPDSIFDVAMLANLQDIAGDNYLPMLQQLRKLYQQNAPKIMEQLKAKFAGDDVTEIGTLAHTLKSMSYNIGAKQMGEACQRLENCALLAGDTIGSQADLPVLFDVVCRQYELVTSELAAAGIATNASDKQLQEAG